MSTIRKVSQFLCEIPKEIKSIVGIFFLSRAFFFLVTILLVNFNEKTIGPYMTCRYDCWWYFDLIEHGYMREVLTTGQVGAANWAFFPVFPMMVKILSYGSPVNSVITGILLNQIFFLVFIILMNKYLKSRFSNFDTRTFTLLYCFSPLSIYFNSLYTETTLILLLSVVLVSLSASRYIIAGIFGALLTGTRSIGISYILLYFFQAFKSQKSWSEQRTSKYIGLLIFPLGLFFFSIYLYRISGDAFAYITIQSASAWGWPSGNILQWIYGLPEANSKREWSNLLCLVTALIICGVLLKKKLYIEFYVLFAPVLLSIITNSITYRYFFVLYPPYLVVNLILNGRPRMRILVLFLNMGMLCAFINWWILGARFLV